VDELTRQRLVKDAGELTMALMMNKTGRTVILASAYNVDTRCQRRKADSGKVIQSPGYNSLPSFRPETVLHNLQSLVIDAGREHGTYEEDGCEADADMLCRASPMGCLG
jgi:hypothetical protein